MKILRTNLDGTNPQITEVNFSDPGSAAAYLQYAEETSAEGDGCLIVVGEGFENDPGRKTLNVVAISGVVVMDNIAQ